jgi:SPP1 family predicted phage head-tail adaptor
LKTSPSQFDKRITLQYPTIAKDAMGAAVTTWNDAATVWAKKTTHRSDEAVQAMATTGIQIHNFRIQFRMDIKSSWRIKQGNACFAIIAPPIEVVDGVMKYLDITVKEAK